MVFWMVVVALGLLAATMSWRASRRLYEAQQDAPYGGVPYRHRLERGLSRPGR